MVLPLPFLLVVLLQCIGFTCGSSVEEFHISSPLDLHTLAMNSFLAYRRDVDPKAGFEDDGPLAKRAQEYAAKRFVVAPQEAMSVLPTASATLGMAGGAVGDSGDPLLLLPSPASSADDNDVLAAVVSSQQSSYELMPKHASNAMAASFNENVGLGAISRAGALPMGGEGAWLALVEEKRKKENALDYHAMLWELGSEIAEKEQVERGGINVTAEALLLASMKKWFADGGGRLFLTEPEIGGGNQGFRLVVTEDVAVDDTVLSVPLKLIMCRQTARNVVITGKGKYLGEELNKAFEKNEAWAMSIFLLHEYFKEVHGNGSKWGPFLRVLRMRTLTTDAVQELRGTKALQLMKQWLKSAEDFLWWSSGSDGPCSPISGICRTKPQEKHGENRFNLHQLRWAYWVVMQNSVRIKQVSTGLEFIALVPFYDMLEKRPRSATVGKLTHQLVFGLDGSVSVRAGEAIRKRSRVAVDPGNLTDPEYFLRYLAVPADDNQHNYIKLSLPGAIPQGSKFHFCMKGTLREQNRDVCRGSFKSESMFWKSKVLGEWRTQMNLPPRLQELRMWATRLHLYGGKEETDLLSAANQIIAGLPIPVDQMPAEEQLALLGVSPSMALMPVAGKAGEEAQERPPPQLYSAPDPTEDPQAQRAMESLASLAFQAQAVWATGNAVLNATRTVLNQTRDFFLHGVLPDAGLDQLDEFLLKKIGMLAHCGFENDMKITAGNITDELLCAMRVHLMNESEMQVFCPKDVRIWEENCHNVEFLNFTAISEVNEVAVVTSFRNSLNILLGGYPQTHEEDVTLLQTHATSGGTTLGPVVASAVRYRLREKRILLSALEFLDDHEEAVRNGSVVFQLELKARERVEANERAEQHRLFMEQVQAKAALRAPLAVLDVNMGADQPKVNITLEEGRSLEGTVLAFCRTYGVGDADRIKLEEALRAKVVSPAPLALLLGVVLPNGFRRVLGIPAGANATLEAHVFCTKNDVESADRCDAILARVQSLVDVDSSRYIRRVLLNVPINAPDGRKLQLVLREGEQHDLRQYVADFFELYRMPSESIDGFVAEVNKRLAPVALVVPVDLPGKRRIIARFSEHDNVTATVEAFMNYFELGDETLKIAIMKRARHGLAPGTFLV